MWATSLALLTVVGLARADSKLNLGDSIDFKLSVNGSPWFSSGNVSVTIGNTTYSTATGTLKKVGAQLNDAGTDGYGDFSRVAQNYSAGGTAWSTSYRVYSNKFAVFEQSFPDGADATAVVKGDVSSCFPSINPTVLDNQPRGFVSWQGRFLEASRGGVWQQGSGSGSPGVATGGSGGPFVVFNSDMTDSLVFSPASNFMTNTAGMSPVKDDGSFCFGLDGPVTSVPSGYSLETMVYLGSGVNSVMKEFGTTLLNKFQTVRPEDYTTKWLGYSTDNGAYFYYGWHTTPDIQNYQQALEGVHAYSVSAGIPYKHILLDSWWYTKGAAGGLKEWDATNSTFPDGLAAFAEKTGWQFQMHNRMWSSDNVYAKQNGGDYNFDVEPANSISPTQISLSTKDLSGPELLQSLEESLRNQGSPGHSGLAIPDDQSLWNDLMSNKTTRGVPLRVYEQDWLYNEWEGLLATRTSPTLSRRWLMQMGAGAAKSNVTVQYCMSYARMVMQSVEIPAVTQFRASDDYGPGQTGFYPTAIPGRNATDGSKGCGFPYCVYYVGTTSILAWALQLGPSKDNFWSKPLQPGSAFNRGKDPWHPGTLNATHEPYNEMQCAISSYTTGPVTPSDGIGYSNASLIKMSCRSDGRLLHPTAPARAIDASFALAGGPQPRVNNVHAVMATHTDIGGSKWSHVLVIGLKEDFLLTPRHLGDDVAPGPSIAWWGYKLSASSGASNVTLAKEPFTAAAPLKIAACGYSNFGLYHVAPIHPLSKASFLGELGKWVPVSEDRVVSVDDSASGITVSIIGEPNEAVELAFAKGTVTTGLCTIGASGTATVNYDGQTVTCK